MKILSFLFITVIFFTVQSCYISRPLKEPKTIKIVINFTPEKQDYGNTKYINNYSTDDYKKNYIAELKNELDIYNLKETDKNNPDFTLIIDKFKVSETLSTETVNDEKSEYNGQSFEVSNCSVDVNFSLYYGNVDKEITSTFASASKSEKVTNNRNLGDYITGSNKDNSIYHFKGLNDDIFITLSKKAGRRTVAKLTKKIHKAIKKINAKK